MQKHFRLPLTPTPGSTKTHDFEIMPEIAIEAKGSPTSVVNPDGTISHLDRQGMECSDTKKKAFNNRRTIDNVMQPGYSSWSRMPFHQTLSVIATDVTAVFDVNKLDRLQAMMTEIEDKVDLSALRTPRSL